MSQGHRCPNRARWILLDRHESPSTYTHACDDHVGALRDDGTTHALVIPPEFPCCYRLRSTPDGPPHRALDLRHLPPPGV